MAWDLYHWPIDVVLDEHGTGWHGTQLLTLRIVATLAVATVSYRVVERTVRAARWRPLRPALTFDDGVPSRPVRILLVGDSTAMALGAGMVEWARDGVDLARVTVDGSLGCGFLRSG